MAAPSPATAHHRARVGALSRDRQPNDPEFSAAKRDLAAANVGLHHPCHLRGAAADR